MIRLRLRGYVCSLVVLAVMHVSTRSSAQTGTERKPLESQPPSTKMMNVPIQIAAGDLLEITVFDAPELTQQVRVGADGNVQLALIGDIKLTGLTGQEAAGAIASKFRARKLLIHPQVNVLIKESGSQGVSVMGEVQHPGIYQILGARSLLDVVSMAGGLTNVADTRITIKHRTGSEENVTVKLKNDDPHTSLLNDIQVFPGDLVLVPRAGIVYVLGDVSKPGGFVMQDNGKMTLLQALAQAGGATQTASVNRAVLLRKSDNGYVTNKLQVGKISRGQDADIELHANDIVFLPNSRLKNALKETQSMAQTIGSASIYAIVH